MERPGGVTAIAGIFLLSASYLFVLSLIMLLRPGTVSMMLGSPLLGGLELAGPFMFLLFALLGAAIGIGLLRLNNWARRVATLAAIAGVVMLLPDVSSAVVDFRAAKLFWSWLGVMARVMIAWYLYQPAAVEAFTKPASTSLLK